MSSSSPAANTLSPEKTPERPSAGKRPPSLNELAARIGAQPGAASSSTAATRPRLAASLLRTGSSASTNTTASTTDSVAVNVPTTRSTSPGAIAISPPASNTPEGPRTPGEPLTQEGIERLERETNAASAAVLKKVKGYKNIPSLDAITARFARSRTVSVDGSPAPPEAEQIEDPKTPGLMTTAPEHPLQHTWTIYHDCKTKPPFLPGSATDANFPAPAEAGDYEAGLTTIGEFDTVESFCRYFNWLKPPSKLERNSNYHLFKQGIKPMWEDEANANGGKWVLTMKNNPQLLDRCWQWLTMALVGEELDEGDEICGAVVSLRSKVDRIQLWVRSKEDVAKINGIGKKFVKLLDVSEQDAIGLEFQYNTEDRPLPNKFLSIQAVPVSGFRPSFHAKPGSATPSPVSGPAETPVNGAPVNANMGGGGAFAGFGVGGLGGGNWRSKRA